MLSREARIAPLPHQEVSSARPVGDGRREDRINALAGHDVRNLATYSCRPLLRPGHQRWPHERAHQLGQSVTILDAIGLFQQPDLATDSGEHENKERQRGIRQPGSQRPKLHPLSLELRGGSLSCVAVGRGHRDERCARPVQLPNPPRPLPCGLPTLRPPRGRRRLFPRAPIRSEWDQIIVLQDRVLLKFNVDFAINEG